jgi:hypothetical protein
METGGELLDGLTSAGTQGSGKILLTREPEVAEYPTAVRLGNTRFLATSTTLFRKGAIVLHYRF